MRLISQLRSKSPWRSQLTIMFILVSMEREILSGFQLNKAKYIKRSEIRRGEEHIGNWKQKGIKILRTFCLKSIIFQYCGHNSPSKDIHINYIPDVSYPTAWPTKKHTGKKVNKNVLIIKCSLIRNSFLYLFLTGGAT